MPKVKLESDIYNRAKEFAAEQGYTSVDEFIVHAIETAFALSDTADDETSVEERLRGLGYID